VFSAGEIAMAAAWKLECGACGRHNADFDEVGLQLQCRRCKAITTIPYGKIGNLDQAIAFAKAQRRRFRRDN
jgi:ribosomal protein S27E